MLSLVPKNIKYDLRTRFGRTTGVHVGPLHGLCVIVSKAVNLGFRLDSTTMALIYSSEDFDEIVERWLVDTSIDDAKCPRLERNRVRRPELFASKIPTSRDSRGSFTINRFRIHISSCKIEYHRVTHSLKNAISNPHGPFGRPPSPHSY